MKKITFILFLAFLLLLVPLSFADRTTGTVSSCTITGCSTTNYNSDTTSIGATISKSQSDTVGISVADLTGSTINTVNLTLRHDGDTGISGSWTITYQSVGGGTIYCTDTTIAHVTSDTRDTSIPGSCSWTPARLADLEIIFASGDGSGPTNAFIYYIVLNVDYAPPNTPPTVGLGHPTNNTIRAYEEKIILNVTYNDPEASAGTVIFYNASNNQRWCTNLSVTSGTNVYCSNFTTYPDQEIKWYANASDGTDNVRNGTWNFSIENYAVWHFNLTDTTQTGTYNITRIFANDTSGAFNNSRPGVTFTIAATGPTVDITATDYNGAIRFNPEFGSGVTEDRDVEPIGQTAGTGTYKLTSASDGCLIQAQRTTTQPNVKVEITGDVAYGAGNFFNLTTTWTTVKNATGDITLNNLEYHYIWLRADYLAREHITGQVDFRCSP